MYEILYKGKVIDEANTKSEAQEKVKELYSDCKKYIVIKPAEQ
jgi:hypothetical protein